MGLRRPPTLCEGQVQGCGLVPSARKPITSAWQKQTARWVATLETGSPRSTGDGALPPSLQPLLLSVSKVSLPADRLCVPNMAGNTLTLIIFSSSEIQT